MMIKIYTQITMKKKREINKPLYNIVNRIPKYKISNNINKEEIYSNSKNRININKRYLSYINKDINLSSIKKENKEKEYNEKKQNKLLYINLNPKLSEISINTPKSTLFVNKNNINKYNKYDFYATATYINKTNIKKKKFDIKTAKTMNNAKSIDNKNSNLKANCLNQNINSILSPKKSSCLNIKFRDIEKLENNCEIKNSNYEKKKIDYFLDSNQNIFSNTLSSSLQGERYSLMSLKKDKEKKNNNKASSKIFLTDYAFAGNENLNNLDGDITDYIDIENLKKFDSKTFKTKYPIGSKRILVKKNNYETEYKNNVKNIENYKKIKYPNSTFYKGFSNQIIKNYEEINEEDSKKSLLFYSLKNNLEEENNLNNIAQQIKKNPSTIVINNNININFGNKDSLPEKDKRRYKNLIKNSQIQINNNNGSNSISSLLHKIPLCYKNSESNINIRKKNIINFNNK